MLRPYKKIQIFYKSIKNFSENRGTKIKKNSNFTCFFCKKLLIIAIRESVKI
jgi:hypothetical protein